LVKRFRRLCLLRFTPPRGIKITTPLVKGVKGFFDIKKIIEFFYFFGENIMKKKVIFMGTPDFSLASLEMLAESESLEIIAVYTQPDREAGRGQKIVESPVKKYAMSRGLRIMQPESLKNADAVSQMKALSPDVAVVSAYGKIIPENILAVPPRGCLNIHPSLLPKYRGATPIPSAILNGETVTGISVMLLDPGMDTGPVLKQREEAISNDDTSETLSERLAKAGAELLMDVLPPWLEGKIIPVPQDDSQATYTKVISKEDGKIDWNTGAIDIWRRIRAFQPWPGCFTTWAGRNLKIAGALPLDMPSSEPGKVIPVEGPVSVGIECGRGVLGLTRVQLEGKKQMSVEEFIRGQGDFVGSKVF
jgi:methionyl-tRNA formyltransferase